MAKEIVHEDFGEKIGGAKKDLWAARGLYVDDLLGMNEREAEKYVKKDNVWKKPDYAALIRSGEMCIRDRHILRELRRLALKLQKIKVRFMNLLGVIILWLL